jgi:hypothetical protein
MASFIDGFLLGTLAPSYVCPTEPTPDPAAPVTAAACGVLLLLAPWEDRRVWLWAVYCVTLLGVVVSACIHSAYPAVVVVLTGAGLLAMRQVKSARLVETASSLTRTGAVALSCAAAAFPEATTSAMHSLQHAAGGCGG